MTMTVYGFGSFFRHEVNAQDIDLLIVHDDLSPGSINEALAMKREIIRAYSQADVTVLSVAEEKETNFVATSKAQRIEARSLHRLLCVLSTRFNSKVLSPALLAEE